VKVLLDTQAWLWMLAEPDRLSLPAQDLVRQGENDLLLSAASAWEIAIKHALGKLELPAAPEFLVPALMVQTRVTALAISTDHALRAGRLPPHHRDPIDRVLIAQAQIERVPILTADRRFHNYEVEIIEA